MLTSIILTTRRRELVSVKNDIACQSLVISLSLNFTPIVIGAKCLAKGKRSGLCISIDKILSQPSARPTGMDEACLTQLVELFPDNDFAIICHKFYRINGNASLS